MRLPGFVVVSLCAAAPVSAQSGWSDLPVPIASLRQIGVSVDEGRTLAAPRAIRVLHTSPREGNLPPHLVEFEQLLTDLDTVEKGLLRAGARGLRLDMATNSTDRDVLRDTLESLGLLLRERSGTYSVESKSNATNLRKRLDAAGLDTGTIEKALNRGETVVPSPAITVLPSPLPHELWERAIFERKIPPRSLFSAIVRDRRASLLFYGLLAMTPETRAYLMKEPERLQRLYREAAGAVAAFGDSFRVDGDGHLIVPGNAEAVELWEALAGERLEQTDRFVHALFGSGGRLAYMFDAIGHLDVPHQRFALGLWIGDRGLRLERVRALYRAFADIEPAWLPLERPFRRPLYDPSSLLGLIAVAPQGEPAAPHFRRVWDRALATVDVPGPVTREVLVAYGRIDAAWLSERLLQGHFQERQARFACFAFGQRVFGSAPEEQIEDVVAAIRACGRYPALVMTLDRVGVRRPATYALAARRAREIEDVGNPVLAVPLLAQFQGALLLLERMSRTGAIPPSAMDGLVSSLCELSTSRGRYDGALAGWIETALLTMLPPPPGQSDHPLEATLLRALADTAETNAPFEWEGAMYIADVTAASLRDLAAIRTQQGGNRLDAVMALMRVVTRVRQNGLTLDALKTHTASLKAAGERLVAARAWPDIPDDVPNVKKIVDRAVRDLSRIGKPQDLSKAARIVAPLLDLGDYLLGETIVAVAYAPHLGDPRDLLGPATDLSHRHNFGLTTQPGEIAVVRRAWLRPEMNKAAKGGLALSGSLFGLDLALSAKRLRRLAVDGIPNPPRLSSNDSSALVDLLALMNPRNLRSDDLASIQRAIMAGREHVEAASDEASLDRLAARVRLSASRRQLLAWTLREEPARVPALFSTAEMFWLGVKDFPFERLDFWGTSFEPLAGCYCLRFPAAGIWDRATGRLGGRLLGTAVPDLTLRVAEHLAALNVPAALFPDVMAMATQDFIDGAVAIHDDDWLGTVGYAGRLSQEKVEDYVAALVATGSARALSREAQR